jgi:uncharacterized protein (DUF427 family)
MQADPTPRGKTVTDYPQIIVPVNHVEPSPRRVRAMLDGKVVIDTTSARYVWELPIFPQYYIPIEDFTGNVLVDEDHEEHLSRGTAHRFGLRVGDGVRPKAAHHYTASDIAEIVGTVRVDWAAMDHWFEEDEEVFVHPRSPYTRVDALRSSREVAVGIGDLVLARSLRTVMVFETGLPTRYSIERLDVDWTHLVPSDTQTSCPYKGMTSGYWSVDVGGQLEPDLAWAYDFPTRQLLPIAGLVSFYNEKVDISIDGVRLERPVTKFS